MPYMTELPAALAAQGLDVEIVPGASTRGSPAFNPGGSVSHWTAGPKTGDRPSLNLVTHGRPDLAGPLANTFLPRGLTPSLERVVVVACGRANHAGTGGWRGLKGNSAVFGTEAENSGNGEWTAFQRWAYPRINAAYCELGGFGTEMSCGHHEWAPTRKIDIRDWTMHDMRSQVASLLANPNVQEDDMFTDSDRAALAELYDILTPGKEGVKFNGAVYQRIDDAAVLAREALAAAEATPGKVWAAEVGHGERRRTMSQVLTTVETATSPINRPSDPKADDAGRVSLRQEVADAKSLGLRAVAELEGQRIAIDALARAQGFDPAVVRETVRAGVADALASIETTTTVTIAKED